MSFWEGFSKKKLINYLSEVLNVSALAVNELFLIGCVPILGY